MLEKLNSFRNELNEADEMGAGDPAKKKRKLMELRSRIAEAKDAKKTQSEDDKD